jgi:hypothetical protein
MLPRSFTRNGIIVFLLLMSGLVLAAIALSPSSDVLPIVVKPDADGKLTFRGPSYQFRAWPNQLAFVASMDSNGKPPLFVELSIDRREFGGSEAPGNPRVVCRADGSCIDSCSPGSPCEDIRNGWYRLDVLPALEAWGEDPRPLNLGPVAGTGVLCASAGRAGLELCWDPVRPSPPQAALDARSVSYPGAKGAWAIWVSTARDADGHPTFVTNCGGGLCRKNIERLGARLEITFPPSELDHWQRFDAGLHDFAARLIEPPSDESTHDRQ